MANTIVDRQNSPDLIKLLRASAVAYSMAKNGEIRFTYFLLLLAVAYPICYLFINENNIQLLLFGCSFLITVFIQIVTDYVKGNTVKGAIFKEEYDTTIFNLPWKTTIYKPDRAEVLHYSAEYKGEDIKNWYSPTLSTCIEHNTAVAILQHTNTYWDIELRKKYRQWIINFLILYTITLFTLFLTLKVDSLTIFMILFSLLSFYDNMISIIRGQSDVINKRKPISKHLDEIIRQKKNISINELRDIQDEIYETRKENAKVPNYVFRYYKMKINREVEEYIEEANNLYVT